MTTTHVLVHGDNAYMIASDLSDFTGELSYFALFCSAKLVKSKRDYVDAFKKLKASFISLTEDREISNWTIRPVNELFKRISKLLSSKTINSTNLEAAYDLVIDFLDNEILSESPQCFKHHFLEEALAEGAKTYYSDGLFSAVDSSLEAQNYDGAVLDAFKYLDDSLRKLTGIDSHQIYGEDLVNRVFAPNSGLLQLNTHPNEQLGLRNWFSGANAIFRNPLAHRFVHLDEKSAFFAIAMVALMLKIATELSDRNNKPSQSA